MTHVHVVYAHPSQRSFTREVLDAFLGGLDRAGHSHTVSDLYAMGFRPELTLGYSIAELEASGCHRAMRTAMLTDRIGEKARSSEFIVFGGTLQRDDDGDGWKVTRAGHLARAAELASVILPGA